MASLPPDDDRGPMVLGVCLASTLLALLCVIARLYARLAVHHIGLDDYVIVVAMALSLTGMGYVIANMTQGGGRHMAYLSRIQISTALRLNFVLLAVFMWAITVAKISIALFLMRIAPNRRYRVFLWVIIAVLIFYTVASTITLLLQCQYISGYWDLLGAGLCWAPETLLIIGEAHASLNILTDVTLAILPIYMLWRVQIKFRVKITIFGITGLGIFASAAAIVRAVALPYVGTSDNLLWELCKINIWNFAECNTGIIAASLPTLRSLFKRVFDGSLMHMSRSKPYTLSHGNSAPQPQSHRLHTFVHAGHSEESILSAPIGSHANFSSGAAKGTANSIVKTTAVVIETSAATNHAWPASNGSDITMPERRIEDCV